MYYQGNTTIKDIPNYGNRRCAEEVEL